jgi:hypothetical protein
LQGRAWEEDTNGCDRRAAICFKKAAALAPMNPLYRAKYGRAAARCGKVNRGRRELLAAAASAPGDLSVLHVVVMGLLEVGRTDDARQVVARARFLSPGNRELNAIGERIRFESARLSQQKVLNGANGDGTNAEPRYARDAQFATDGDRVTLPFVRVMGSTSSGPLRGAEGEMRGTVRYDAGSFHRPHLARVRARKADW